MGHKDEEDPVNIKGSSSKATSSGIQRIRSSPPLKSNSQPEKDTVYENHDPTRRSNSARLDLKKEKSTQRFNHFIHRRQKKFEDKDVAKVLEMQPGLLGDRCTSIDESSLPDPLHYDIGDQTFRPPMRNVSIDFYPPEVPASNDKLTTPQRRIANPSYSQIRHFFHEKSLKLNDFRWRTCIGYGSFGDVWLCTYGDKKHATMRSGTLITLPPFAIKKMRKSKYLDETSRTPKSAYNERDILLFVHHHHIVNLYATFQDSEHLYMVQEFLSGGELFHRLAKLLKPNSCLPVNEARFYFAEAYVAIHHLHSEFICYRDIKPENIMIDKDGHVKLIDMGFAKHLDKKLKRKKSTLFTTSKVVHGSTTSIVGTPDYLPPEFLIGKCLDTAGLTRNIVPHGPEVDYWALGILLYELISGHTPFQSSSTQEMYLNILRCEINFPIGYDSQAKDLIKRLLKKKPSQRLGTESNGSIHKHAFLRSHYDMTDMFFRRLEAPWTPTIRDPLDITYYQNIGEPLPNKASRKLTNAEQLHFQEWDSKY